MVTVREVYRQIKETLQQAGIDDAGFEAAQMVRHITGEMPFSAAEVTQEQYTCLQQAAEKRITHYPLQYILGNWSFLGLELQVGPGVLVPRPETEEVCLAAVECVQNLPAPSVLDLCAGSGALALGIKSQKLAASITAVEKEKDAYRYLQKNTEAFNAEHAACSAVRIICDDVFSFYHTLQPASQDLIVCNPPYVTAQEYEELAPELYFEPSEALVGPPGNAQDGLLFYREIIKNYKPILRLGGYMVFEIGALQGEAVKALFRQNGYRHIQIRQDMNGHDRIAMGCV